MKKIDINYPKGFAKIKIENKDDLWYLSQILDKGDLASAKTLRKVTIGDNDTRNKKPVKKPVFIKLQIEKVELSESILKVLGLVREGPDDIPHDSHHSFNIEENTELKIEKESWYNFQKEKLNEALNSKTSNILIVVFDREESYFALMKKYGFEILTHLEGTVQKKDQQVKTSNFYLEIIKTIKEYDKIHSFNNIILASPSFWKEELQKNLDDEKLKKKFVLATCSSVNKSSINEVLKRPEVKKVLTDERTIKEINFVEELMTNIADEKATYGIKEVNLSTNNGAVETLLVSSKLITKLREQDKFEKLDKLMKTADSLKAKIHIISSQHEGGKKLDGISGIGAILRYKNY